MFEQSINVHLPITISLWGRRMDTLFSREQDTQKAEPEVSSAVSLLEQGLNCVQQGRYSEGIAFFSLARERLSSQQMYIATVLDAFIQDYMSYWQAQQALSWGPG
jgi:hypothetical protein